MVTDAPFCQDQASWLQTLLPSQLIANILLSRPSQLITDVPLVKTKPVGRRHSFFIKIKPVDCRRSFSQDQASWSQTLLFVKIKPVDCRRSFLSRPYQLVADVLFVNIKPVDHRHPFVKIKLVDHRRSFLSRSSQLITYASFRQDQASWSQTLPFVKIKPVDRKHPFIKIKPVGRKCLLLLKTMHVGRRHPLSSRSSQFIANSSIIEIKMKKSQSYQLSRVISEFNNYQLSQILSFFVKR